MPRYDYKCFECNDEQELVLPMNHDKPTCIECPNTMTQVFRNAPASHFKGSGFYSTDYKQTNYDAMTNDQRDSFDSEAVDKLDEKYSAEEKAFKEKIKDDLR